MKIGILSRSRKLYSTRQLVKAAAERGHEARVIDTLECYMDINPSSPAIYCQGEKLEGCDAVIPRIGASITDCVEDNARHARSSRKTRG